MAGMTGICPEPCRSSLRSLSPKRAGLEEKDADQPIGVGKQDPPKFKLVVTNGNDLWLGLDASGPMLARTRIGKHELGGDGSWILGGKKSCARPGLGCAIQRSNRRAHDHEVRQSSTRPGLKMEPEQETHASAPFHRPYQCNGLVAHEPFQAGAGIHLEPAAPDS